MRINTIYGIRCFCVLTRWIRQSNNDASKKTAFLQGSFNLGKMNNQKNDCDNEQ